METENNKKTRGFQKGQSGNPGGRPKTLPEVKEAFRAHTIEAKNTLVEIMRDPDSGPGPRTKAAEIILNRAWGTPEQSVAVTGSMNVAAVDTSKLPKEKQTALLDALTDVFSADASETAD